MSGERSRPFVPSNVPYETERRGNEPFWNSRTMDPTREVASEPRGNGASASSEAEVGLGCMDSMVSICKLL
jgi:hypothetical protein